jgi:hypothetical protein
MIPLLLILAAQALAQPQAAPRVERLDESSFLLGLDVGAGVSVGAAQARLAPAAKLACQSRRAVMGRFRFLSEAGANSFEQELLCIDARHRLGTIAAAAADQPLAPERADQQAVLAASYGYFAAKDNGRYGDAHHLLSDGMKQRFPLADWTASARAFDAEAGAVRGRRVVEITWYNNPADAPEPGLYVAADFSAEFAATEFVCGYLMWRVQPDGGFRLVREEQNAAPKRSGGRSIAKIDRDPLRARMGCKDYRATDA